ncbi:MAG: tryptophan--tRNA ligase [Opitutales bacterium]
MKDENLEQAKKVVLTCAQPTGKLHLGNYLGALKYWVELSNNEECYFGIADMHAITMPYTPADLRKNVYDCLAQYLACGLNPDSAIFPQSAIKGHADLAWCLACLCPIGNLERMTQFKDKSKKQQNSFIGSGLLYYPVLMAADILIYNADIVPVGVDQKQHMELARDLAQKFNMTYSDTFKIPEASIPETGARIMSLQNPESKMSKSDANQSSVIYITDPSDVLRKKIMSAVTDSDTVVKFADDKKAISNLMSIYSVITKKSMADIEAEFEGKGYGDFKKAVAEAVIEHLSPIREKYESLLKDKAYLDSVLQNGIEKAQRRANRIMSKVWRKVGFYTK